MYRFVFPGIVAAFLAAGPAAAGDKKHVEVRAPGVHVTVDKDAQAEQSAPFRLIRTSMIIGEKVENPEGQNLGDIKEVAIDVNRSRVAYAVLDFGGILGAGDKYFAVPFQAMNYHPDQKVLRDDQKFVLDVDKQRLKEAQGFDKTRWPDMADQRWAREIHAFYGQQPYWLPEAPPDLHGEPISSEKTTIKRGWLHRKTVTEKALRQPGSAFILKAGEEMVGHPVRHASNNERLGEINDILVDRRAGDLAFIVLKLDRNSSAMQYDRDRNYVALPVQMFSFDRHGDPIAPYTVECCLEKLKQHRFSASSPPDLTDRAWARSLYDDFGRVPYWEKR